MKKILGLLFVLVIVLSCSNDDEESGAPYMSAVIDGSDWKPITRVTVLDEDKFVITGVTLTGETLVITILGTAEGVYELNLTAVQCGAVYKETAGTSTEDAYVSATGEVELTNVNSSKQEITGTFSFTVAKGVLNTKTITEGTFRNLAYTITGEQ